MAERDGYIPGVPCWVDTSQPDPDAAGAFYSGLFGWEVEDAMPAGSESKYLVARLRGGDVAAISSKADDGSPVAWQTYVWVDSADETAARVRDAGGHVMVDPFDVLDAGRMAVFADPEGAVMCAWQPRRHRGARIVNEHGALNFNVLNTRDEEGARAFYGAVFGWNVFELPGARRAWALPGYGDHLEELTPGLRARTAEFGVPGFEDVVAALASPAADDRTPAHWGVTFGADDADAIAGQAVRLGGEVVVPPFDGPFVRMTVIRDPQGATFTASQFKPENAIEA